MGKAKAAGSFFGGLFGNPIVALLLLGLGGLLIFRKDITNFLDKGIGNITLPEIKFPDIKFPEFPKFPEINFPDFTGVFEGFQESQSNFFEQFTNLFTGGGGLEQPQKMVEDTGLIDFSKCKCGATIIQDAFGNVFSECKICKGAPDVLPNPALDLEPSDAELFAKDFPETFVPTTQEFQLTPAQQFVLDKAQPLPEGFGSGGLSFIGGSINPTPIANLSLSQIIDMFDVTASQAANILAIAKDDFGDFDFGTNTGGGIGSVIPSINEFIGGSDVNVSSSQFEGLSAQEIANILTGGNIQNF